MFLVYSIFSTIWSNVMPCNFVIFYGSLIFLVSNWRYWSGASSRSLKLSISGVIRSSEVTGRRNSHVVGEQFHEMFQIISGCSTVISGFSKVSIIGCIEYYITDCLIRLINKVKLCETWPIVQQHIL